MALNQSFHCLLNSNLNIEIKYLKRARRLTIRVLGTGAVRVTAPIRTKESEIQMMLDKHSNWILEKYKMIESRPKAKLLQMINGEVLPFYGQQLILKIIDGKGTVSRFENELIVPVPLKLTNFNDETFIQKHIQKLLIKWYQAQALKKITERVPFFENQIQVQSKSISIKNYKSRWGSCSSKGDLIFNWQIIAFEKILFDYVIAHEICHLKEMNHSPKFYAWLTRLGFRKSEIHRQMKNVRNLF